MSSMPILALDRVCRIGGGIVAALLCTVSGSLVASADAAPPWNPGDAIGEPTGAVGKVAITHEDLDFDLRPLARGDPVRVHATYQLRNDAVATSASLVFLADHALTGRSTFAVSFDGSAVPATPTTLTILPDAWKPPTSTPSLIEGQPGIIPYDTTPGTAFQFTVAIPPGPHRLSVDYAVLPGRFAFPGQTTDWQIAYVLAPARQWETYGDLSVTATLPTGWRARSIPDLPRYGDSLSGHFVDLPSNAMTITASFPRDPYVQSVTDWLPAQWALFLALLVLTIAFTTLWIRTTSSGWMFAPFGAAWALPALAQWFRTGYVTPPATQFGGGKCGAVTAGCLLLPGALVVVAVAAGLGLAAMVIAILLAGLVWSRLRQVLRH
jgi:hypothetical protein